MRIRAAQPGDRRAVRALCARIWSDDYVPLVFDAWVRDRKGRFWVATEGRRVVGIAKLTLSERREAWLHALRVDPRYRRRGVATALLQHRLERARRLGARVARLDTAEDNVAVHRLMRRFGFRRIARVCHYSAQASTGGRPRRAARREVAAVWRLLRERRAMLYEAHFARRVVRDDVVGAIRDGRCLVIGPPGSVSGAALVRPVRDREHGSRLLAEAVAGTGPGLRHLLRAVRAEAEAQGLARAGIAAPEALWRIARDAGYGRRWPETMFVFERQLERRPGR
ncbi:MAG TPA: GNAT family N-acetyltransferase [Candidatus Saccharimonadales bacterium]|nr:GNAT family N-acetyltransferase [Candidatus Saccharimonadales bacterium]